MSKAETTPPTKAKSKAKEAKDPKDPNAPKKERAPRKDYGWTMDSKIHIVDKENKYKGARSSWFELVCKCEGKTVQHFVESAKGITNKQGKAEPPRGWLRFFVESGKVTLRAPEQTARAA